ncbi:MAG TPA: tetratricopeptide repeat protein [Sphingobium sp.]
MRSTKWALLLSGLLSGAALAGSDKPIMAPPPDWVKPVALPSKPEKAGEAPVHILLLDQQSKLEPGRVTAYVDLAMLIQSPEGLQAGNLSLPWNPETNEITVHKLVIHRDGKLIDVLAGGQNFTVVRREPNLENATLDGMLTANIQPEGLQVGDVLEYAVTLSSADPIFKDHAEELAGGWNGVPFSRTHMSVQWPNSMAVAVRQNGALPPLKPVKVGNMTKVELSLDNVQPTLPPRLAPARYGLGRLVEFSDFKSWADLGALMAPLYAKASVIPAQGPLRNEVEKIKAASADPVKRTEAALALVQDRVRYVALLMGTGGYVPATAEETWSRRYGDCKAKSALLLALLRELGVEAEPVAANAISGDGIDRRLPMIGLFNHVLLRAHIAGADYWLDGTRQGDTSLARLRVPDFGWGLPLVAQGAALVRMQPKPLEQPEKDIEINIDARAGISVPAPIKVKTTLRGDAALGAKLAMGRLTETQRDQSLREFWKDELKDIDVTSVSARYDPETGEEILTMEGKANMDWSDGWYHADRVYLGYDPDFSRSEGPDKDAPFANDYPSFTRTMETIQLPAGFPEEPEMPAMAVDQTIGGTTYFRKASLVGNVFRIEASARSVAPEFAAKDAPAVQTALKAITDQIPSFRRPTNYRMTSAEVDAAKLLQPTTAKAYVDRGVDFMNNGQRAEAKSDFDAAIALDAKYVWAFANRAILNLQLNDTKAAQLDLDAAAAIDPENSVLWHARGQIARMRKAPQEAIAAFSHSIANNPKDNWAIIQRAGVYAEQRDFDAALDDMLRLEALDPGNEIAKVGILNFRMQKRDFEGAAKYASGVDLAKVSVPDLATMVGNVAFMRGDSKGAIAGYSRSLELKADQPHLLAGRAQAYMMQGNNEGALADAAASLKINPKQADLHLIIVNVLRRMGKKDEALAQAEAMLKSNPDDGYTHVVAAKIFDGMGQHERGMAEIDKAIALKPDATAYTNRAVMRSKSDVEGRLADFDAALKLDPSLEDALLGKAEILIGRGEFGAAVKSYTDVIDKWPKNPLLRNRRAIAYVRSGDMVHADADFEQARKDAEVAPGLLNDICYAKATANVALNRALDECNAALAKQPDAIAIMDSKAFVLLRLGRNDEAIALFDKVLAKSPEMAVSLYGRAVARAHKGDKGRAQTDRDAALKVNPDVQKQFESYGVTM